MIIGSIVVLVGIPIYLYFSPHTDIHHLKDLFTSEEAIFERNLERKNGFLANGIRLIAGLVRRIKKES